MFYCEQTKEINDKIVDIDYLQNKVPLPFEGTHKNDVSKTRCQNIKNINVSSCYSCCTLGICTGHCRSHRHWSTSSTSSGILTFCNCKSSCPRFAEISLYAGSWPPQCFTDFWECSSSCSSCTHRCMASLKKSTRSRAWDSQSSCRCTQSSLFFLGFWRRTLFQTLPWTRHCVPLGSARWTALRPNPQNCSSQVSHPQGIGRTGGCSLKRSTSFSSRKSLALCQERTVSRRKESYWAPSCSSLPLSEYNNCIFITDSVHCNCINSILGYHSRFSSDKC